MIWELARFEWRIALRSPATWVYLLAYTVLAGMWTLAYVGKAPGMDISLGSEKLWVNSPYVLSQVIALSGLFGIFSLSSIMGRAGAADVFQRTEAMILSKPISRAAHLGGRFLGGFGTVLFIFSGLPIGAWLAVHSGLPGEEMIGPESLLAYVRPMWLSIWPSLFACGAFFFALTALCRRMSAVYVGAVVLLLGWMWASGQSPEAGSAGPLLHALLDPTGIFAADRDTLYWSVADKNNRALEFGGALLWNRLLWVGFGMGCLVVAYMRFNPSQAGRKKDKPIEADTKTDGVLLVVTPDPQSRGLWRMWRAMTVFELRAVTMNRYFIAMLICAVLFMMINAMDMGELMGTTTLPVTWQVLSSLGDGFGLFALIMVTFYAGDMVHRERDDRIHDLYGALPIPDWICFTSKIVGLMLLVSILTALMGLCGIFLQLAQGWTEFNLPLYAVELILIRGWRLLMISVLAISAHVILQHKQGAHLFMVLFFLLNLAIFRSGVAHPLVVFGLAPPAVWSDMNGYGSWLVPHLAYKLYWTFFCGVLIMIASAFWERIAVASMKQRLGQFSLRSGKPLTYALGLTWLAFGAFLIQMGGSEVLETQRDGQADAAELEHRYAEYADVLGFSVDHADLRVDLFPKEDRVEIAGTYHLKNRWKEPLDLIIVNAGEFLEYAQMMPSASHDVVVVEERFGFFVFKLTDPVAPGDVTQLTFDYQFQRASLPARRDAQQLYRNGTFLERDFFPMMGFPVERTLTGTRERERFELPKRRDLPGPETPGAELRSGLGGDTAFASLRMVISTDVDQTPMAPAPLVATSVEEGRRVSVFETSDKTFFYPTAISARYDVARDQWRDVGLSIYFHPNHHRNVSRMMAGLKDSLDYCTAAFGPYPQKYLRILEFPRYKQFAQALTGTIPFSESAGFIARVDDRADGVDYPYFVTAHETAHQWWPHQVLPADASGANMLSESLAQYTALKIYERRVGKDAMRAMMKLQQHMYLQGRAAMNESEPPLYQVDDQDFIAYYKGGPAFYALADVIGEDQVNLALQRYISLFDGVDRFALSTDLIQLLREVTPSNYQYLIDDLFEHVTLHQLQVLSVTRQEGGDLRVQVEATKHRAQGLGDLTPISMHDEVMVGFLDAEGELLETKRVWLETGVSELIFKAEGEVAEVVLDPFHLLVDTTRENNSKAVISQLKELQSVNQTE